MSENDAPEGKVISFPNGEKLPVADIGVDFVLDRIENNHFSVPEVVDQSALIKDMRERESYVAGQELVRAVRDKMSASDIVDQVVVEIAEELAHLKFERTKKAREGGSTSSLTVSRILSLRQLSEVLMKRMENARAEQLNLKSPRFREVLKLWMEFVYESMQKSNVPDEVIDLVFRQMEADMTDWEKRVSDLLWSRLSRMPWTIYCHTHIETGRHYVGLTKKTWQKRWNQHCSQAKSSKDGRWHFPNAIRKYGKEAFTMKSLRCVSIWTWRTLPRSAGSNYSRPATL